jgi:uncharacterized membrane protein YeaQ/YmgE (transglycosylase-associated protein family)
MNESAFLALSYLRENLLASLGIAIAAGFAANKTVVLGKTRSFVLCIVVGVVGSFIGQFAIFYFGLRELLDELTGFRYLFDFIAAYVGSFILAAMIHFVKPQ